MKTHGVLTLAVSMLLLACSPSNEAANGDPADAAAAASTAPAGGQVDNPVASTAGGRDIEPEALPLIQGGAKIAASIVACDLGTKEQALEGFAAQRASYVEQGYSAASYDRAVDDAFREVEAKFAAVSAAEKAEACESVKQLGDQFNRMGEEMLRGSGSAN